jgi:Mn-dependent DtxR family transcriptional regulator
MSLQIQSLLLNELTERKNRNPAYSLRALARDLGISVTALSDVLAGKRQFSRKNVSKVISALHLSPEVLQRLDARSPCRRIPRSEQERMLLEEDHFRLIADWYYLAILNLAKIRHNKAQPSWIAERLGLEMGEVKEALDRLRRLKLLTIKNGKLVRIGLLLETTRDIPSAAIRRHHLENLRLAENSLLNDPVHAREFSSTTVNVNVRNLRKAKDLLMKAKQRVAKMLDDQHASEVYTISFQLFPLTKVAFGEGDIGEKPNP